VLLLAVLLAGVAPWGAGESRGEDLSIKVVTFGEGDDVTEWFGHAAVVVEDRRLHESRLYNYGEYSFDRAMVGRYAMGHLEFSVGERPVERTLALYGARDRAVRMQELWLSPAQKLALAARLADNVLPAHRRYLYDHYADNCTTRVRDVLDAVLGGQLRAQAAPTTKTLRQRTQEKTSVSPTMGWLIDFILNDSADQPMTTWQEAFLPDQLEKQLAAATVVDETGAAHPLVQATSTWWPSSRPPLPPPTPLSTYAGAGLVVAAIALLLRRRRALGGVSVVVGGAFGAVGSALFFMATFTDHHVARGNENLLLASPLTLLLVPAGLFTALGKGRRALRATTTSLAALSLVAVACKLLPWGDQDNARALVLLVPVWLALAASSWATPRT
jgi:hypothetical protein